MKTFKSKEQILLLIILIFISSQTHVFPMILLNNFNKINGHEYVDLGLPSGTLWATCNIGASNPSDYGDHFAWGETETKSSYSFENLKYRTSGSEFYDVKFSKYVTSSDYGKIDNKEQLEMQDDAARTNWGGTWRMPTKEEWQELYNNCTWQWISKEGHEGYEITSNINKNSIFLPAAGYRVSSYLDGVGNEGAYWSSSLYLGSSSAYYCCFYTSIVKHSLESRRCHGCSIRPVSSREQSHFTHLELHKKIVNKNWHSERNPEGKIIYFKIDQCGSHIVRTIMGMEIGNTSKEDFLYRIKKENLHYSFKEDYNTYTILEEGIVNNIEPTASAFVFDSNDKLENIALVFMCNDVDYSFVTMKILETLVSDLFEKCGWNKYKKETYDLLYYNDGYTEVSLKDADNGQFILLFHKLKNVDVDDDSLIDKELKLYDSILKLENKDSIPHFGLG